MKTKKIDQFASTLLHLSLNDHRLLSAERVSAIIAVLRETFEDMDLEKILNAYLIKVEKFRRSTKLLIEHCGAISDADLRDIRQYFESLLGHKLEMIVSNADSLIAGLRISVADFIFENSIRGTLAAYKATMHSR